MSDNKKLIDDLLLSLKNARRGQVLISVANAEEIKEILELQSKWIWETVFTCGCGMLELNRYASPSSIDPDCEPCCRMCEKEIKDKLKQPEVPDDLVEKFYALIDGYRYSNTIIVHEVKEKIRKLLQQRQPEKVKITRGEVEEWLEEKWCEDWCDPSYFNAILNWLIDLLKSKGFEVVEK